MERFIRIRIASRSSTFVDKTFLSLLIIVALCLASCGGVSSRNARDQQPLLSSKLVVVPDAVDFSEVVVGQKNSQTIRMSNEDTENIQVKAITATGAGFTISGLRLPLKLAPKATATFNVAFAPRGTGSVNGTVTIESSLGHPVRFLVKGAGAGSKQKLQTNPIEVSFGKIAVKGKAQKAVVLSNSGNANISVDRFAVAGNGFSVSELPAHFTLEPQQHESFVVTFHPGSKGTFNGSVQFFSKSLTTPVTVTLNGSGVDASEAPARSDHTVSLDWDPSPGNIRGYFIYRGEESGGPYERLNSQVTTALDYSDSQVASGRDYFYVVTSVNHGGHESNYSREISVTIPNP